MNEFRVCLVLCNCPDAEVARQLARGAVDAGLAACVNLLPAIESVYRWQGRTEIASEVPLLLKTTQDRYPQLQAWLAGQHPYEVPEIVALPVISGLPAYLQWVGDSVQGEI